MFEIYRRALIELQVSVFEVDVDAFLPPDIGRITSLLAGLRAFKPDLAIGLPYGSYALICRMPRQRNGWRPNLFLDVLEIPTICIWDHAPVEQADQILSPLPNCPANSTSGALDILRRVLTNPLLVHWSRDTGQTRIMRQLGFVRPHHVIQTGTPALPGFTPAATSPANEKTVAFIGNFYQDLASLEEPELEGLQNTAMAQWMRKSTALWDEIADCIAALPADRRQNLALEKDQTFFWRFAHQLIERVGQTKKRLHLLGEAGTAVTIFGDFRANAADVPANLQANPERFRFGSELAAAFARHPITIDVLSSAFVDGYSFKSIIGFASGGFVLLDRKRDFIDSFGELGMAVSYAHGEDLAAKVDRFLTNPRERRELGDAMRAEIRANHTFSRVLGRVLQSAAEIIRTEYGRNPTAVAQTTPNERASVLLDLLPALQTHSYWLDARLDRVVEGALITTSPSPWAYSAEIPIGELPATLGDPYVRFELVVEAGRVGICLLCTQTGELMSEQLVSASAHAVSLDIELPRDILATIIVRNTTEGPSRVRLMTAELCERI